MECNQVIYIRVDANSEIATGHVMRTLAIAKQIRKLGGECKFIVSDEYAKPIINNSGFEVICLQSQWNDLDKEIPQMQELIETNEIKVLLIDSYSITKKYLKYLRDKVYVAYIDDLNLFKYPVHLVINYSNYYERFRYDLLNYNNKETKFLLGCKYIPLREEFKKLVRKKKENITDILVTTGGTDEYHVTYAFLNHICKEKKIDNINLHVVIGRFNRDVEKINQLSREYDNIKVYQDIDYMSKLMMMCDLGISAGGTTLFELCACGLPTICFVIADNQLMGTKELAEKGFMYNIGDIRNDIYQGILNIEKQINYLIQSPSERYKYSEKMQKLVDGKGAERIARYLLNIAINE